MQVTCSTITDLEGDTLFQDAAKRRRLGIMKLLHKKSDSFLFRGNAIDDKTPLEKAIERGDIDIIQWILKSKADLGQDKTICSNGKSPLLIAAHTNVPNKFEIMSLLLKNARHGYFFNDINLLIYLAVRNSDADLRFAQAEGATTTLTPEGYCSAIESIWGPRLLSAASSNLENSMSLEQEGTTRLEAQVDRSNTKTVIIIGSVMVITMISAYIATHGKDDRTILAGIVGIMGCVCVVVCEGVEALLKLCEKCQKADEEDVEA